MAETHSHLGKDLLILFKRHQDFLPTAPGLSSSSFHYCNWNSNWLQPQKERWFLGSVCSLLWYDFCKRVPLNDTKQHQAITYHHGRWTLWSTCNPTLLPIIFWHSWTLSILLPISTSWKMQVKRGKYSNELIKECHKSIKQETSERDRT